MEMGGGFFHQVDNALDGHRQLGDRGLLPRYKAAKHLVADCPNKEKSSKDENIKSMKDNEGKKITFKKKKKGHVLLC